MKGLAYQPCSGVLLYHALTGTQCLAEQLFILLVLFVIEAFACHQSNNKNYKNHYTKRNKDVDYRTHEKSL